jgi:hypothetical protein
MIPKITCGIVQHRRRDVRRFRSVKGPSKVRWIDLIAVENFELFAH